MFFRVSFWNDSWFFSTDVLREKKEEQVQLKPVESAN